MRNRVTLYHVSMLLEALRRMKYRCLLLFTLCYVLTFFNSSFGSGCGGLAVICSVDVTHELVDMLLGTGAPDGSIATAFKSLSITSHFSISKLFIPSS